MIVPSTRTVVRVLVVDDSPICRELLRETLEAEHDVVVVGEADSGPKALELVRALRPDLVTMDIRMPGLDGLATIERLMSESPTPVLVVTDLPVEDDGDLAFEATRRGALDIARKPMSGDGASERVLRARVRMLATVPVVRHLLRRLSLQPRPRAVAASAAAPSIVGIGASAGGPAALSALLGALPASFPATIAVAQHLPRGFASSFARYLASRSRLRVVVAERSTPLERGTIVLAPDDAHLVALGHDSLGPSYEAAELGIRPSGDALLRSIAEHHGASAVGVVLSGIGADGTEGLLAIRKRGGTTFAQDESTSIVYGMPKAARDRGAAMRVLPVDAIASALVELVGVAKR